MSQAVTDVIKAAGEAERIGDAPRAESMLRDALKGNTLRDGPGAAQQGDLCNALGGLLGRMGRLVDAEQAFEHALAADASLTIARFNLGNVFVARGEYCAAAEHFEQVLREQPDHAGSLLSLGSVCNAIGKYEQAILYYRRFLEKKPGYAHAWVYLGASFQYLSDFGSARECYERALTLDPHLADGLCNLGKLYQSEENHRQAEKYLRQTLEIAPDHPVALAGLATLLERARDYKSGLALLEPAMQLTPSAEIVVAYASLCRRLNRPHDAESKLKAILARQGLALDSQVQTHFSLGHIYDAMGDYDKAFDQFKEGNDLKPVSYDCDSLISSVDALIRVFDHGFADRLPGSGLSSEAPVFIIGMPRTGKSLLEQMLAVHPDMNALGELTEIGNISSDLRAPDGRSYPASLTDQDSGSMAETMKSMGNRYLEKMAGGALRCTDTLPGNFVHLGLIELLFPNAHVIHLKRDVLDTCLSCYFKNFAGLSLAYAFDWRSIGVYYREYTRLMHHWRTVTGLRMLDVSYEMLVSNTETTLAKTLDFLGLDYYSGCLDFHDSDSGAVQRVAHEPLHRRDIGMHRSYLHYLEPLTLTLGPELLGDRAET